MTDRGQPKAVLGPVPGMGRLTSGVAEGSIHKAEEVDPAPVRRVKAARSIVEVLEEDRNQ